MNELFDAREIWLNELVPFTEKLCRDHGIEERFDPENSSDWILFISVLGVKLKTDPKILHEKVLKRFVKSHSKKDLIDEVKTFVEEKRKELEL